MWSDLTSNFYKITRKNVIFGSLGISITRRKKTIKCIIAITCKAINEQSAILKEVKELCKYLFDPNEANFDEVEFKTIFYEL